MVFTTLPASGKPAFFVTNRLFFLVLGMCSIKYFCKGKACFHGSKYLPPCVKYYSVFFLVNIFSLLFLTQFSFLNFNTGVSYYRVGNGDFFAPCRMIAVTDVSK
jgi:hypothetical protein